MSVFRLTFLFVFLLFNTCLFAQQELEGTWKRVQDEATNEEEFFEGNILEVQLEDAKFIGKLIQLVPDAKQYGYKVGQVKWKNFQKIAADKYLIDLLLMDVDDNFEFKEVVYLKANLTLIDADTIKIRIGDHPRIFSGKMQKYVRIGLENS